MYQETPNKESYYIHRQQHTCRNCGGIGHIYKSCPQPIMSFGIICYRINEDKIEYLMIQRRDSLSFMEFIRGKYDLNNIEYIKRLMSNMTAFERELLLVDYFDDLWNKVWYQPYIPKQTQEFLDAKDRFIKLRKGFYIQNQFITMYKLLKTVETKYTEPEWGFPKGRRRLKEKDVDCAIREFCEETGFKPNELNVLENYSSYEEIFYGTNDIQYRHVYYIATLTSNPFRRIIIDPNNPHQAREVRQVEWFSAEDVLKKIREHNVERKQLFIQAHKQVIQQYDLSK
uniref:Nudix hydrolase domain-containing protein n=1 Tax=viral metagenome TaxID=1070528 RepID=A0A6C0CQ42_9ZZZZ